MAYNVLQSFYQNVIDNDESLSQIENDSRIIYNYCSITGFRVGTIFVPTLHAAIQHAIYSLNLHKYDDQLMVTRKQFQDGVDMIIDHLAMRNLTQCRPSIVLNYENGIIATSNLPKNYRFAILFNSFLYDPENKRDAYVDFENQIWRMTKVIEAGRFIMLRNDGVDMAGDLESALDLLTELDAKYSLRMLKMTAKEKELWESFRHQTVEAIDFKALDAFLIRLIKYRDQTQDISVFPNRWTQPAFRGQIMHAADRAEYSNVLNPVTKLPTVAQKQAAAKKAEVSESRAANNAAVASLFAMLKMNV